MAFDSHEACEVLHLRFLCCIMKEGMALRSITAVFLLLAGSLLMAAPFGLSGHLSIKPRMALTTDATDHSTMPGCHDESAPTKQGPQDHDCCTVGHQRALGSASLTVVPAVISVSRTLASSALSDHGRIAIHTQQRFDTGPPGSGTPIRI